MEKLKSNDRALLENIFRTSQGTLLNAMKNYLCNKKYDKVIKTKKYLYAVGNLPIALVAHCDTVFPCPPNEIFYDQEKNVLWSPNGLGADDRAGIWIIIKLIRAGYRPHIILTTDEERGGLGAIALVKDLPKPFAEMKYIIQLDRRGTNDCVFYDCYNEKFIDYVESFGFCEAFGTFSDISTICPAWKIAGVNLSVGYQNEHSVSEILYLGPMDQTIKKVSKMLDDVKNAETFKYIKYSYQPIMTDINYICCKCGKTFKEYDVIPIKKANGSTGWVCPDCISGFGWCERCNEAYELTKDCISDNLCPDCEKIIFDNRGKVKWTT